MRKAQSAVWEPLMFMRVCFSTDYIGRKSLFEY